MQAPSAPTLPTPARRLLAALGRTLSIGLNGLTAAALVVLAVAGQGGSESARANEAAMAPPSVAVGLTGVAVAGHDLVAFFIGDKAVRGQPDITAVYKGATYRFANTRNRDTFLTHPEAFLPQFGGYDALEVRHGRKRIPGPAMAWQVVDNRLYVFRNEDNLAAWNADREANAYIAAQVWAQIRDLPPEVLTAQPAAR